MRARDLATPQPTVRGDASVAEAARVMADPQVRAVLVQDANGRLLGVLSSSLLLKCLLPVYIQADEQLAGVLDEKAAGRLWDRLQDRRLADVLPKDREVLPLVEMNASLIEVASVMVRSGCPLVAVVEKERVVGGITLQALLEHLILSR